MTPARDRSLEANPSRKRRLSISATVAGGAGELGGERGGGTGSGGDGDAGGGDGIQGENSKVKTAPSVVYKSPSWRFTVTTPHAAMLAAVAQP